jgi:hypothetical protein
MKCIIAIAFVAVLIVTMLSIGDTEELLKGTLQTGILQRFLGNQDHSSGPMIRPAWVVMVFEKVL